MWGWAESDSLGPTGSWTSCFLPWGCFLTCEQGCNLHLWIVLELEEKNEKKSLVPTAPGAVPMARLPRGVPCLVLQPKFPLDLGLCAPKCANPSVPKRGDKQAWTPGLHSLLSWSLVLARGLGSWLSAR